MDRKLLLAIQSVCNAAGLKIPWDKVGQLVDDKVSDGAVIQHLAKLRQRMVKQGVPVPPPLRRGGGTMMSSGKNVVSAKVTANILSGGLSAPVHETNEDDEEIDVDKATDMDEEYGQPHTKRSKREKKAGIAGKAASKPKGQVGIKIEDSDGDEGSSAEQKGKQMVTSKKRKRGMKKTGLGKGKGLPKEKGSSPRSRARRSSVDYAELSAGFSTSEDGNDSVEDEEYVGAAAPYMKFAETPDSDEDEKKVVKQIVPPSNSANPSKVVVLQVGAAKLLEEAKRLEVGAAIKSGDSSESDEETEVDTDEHVETMEPWMDPEPDLGHNGVFGSTYANPDTTAYHQYDNTAPMFGVFNTAANDPLTVGDAYGSLATNNDHWFAGPGYTHSSFTTNAMPNLFRQPAVPATRVTIPQQASGPNVEMIPTSATSTYSGHTPRLMGDQYYAALDEGMDSMDPFSQAYLDPTSEDPMLGPDDGFGYFNF